MLTSAGDLAQNSVRLQNEVTAFLVKLREDKKAVLMEWNDQLKLGINSIDQQHHRLIDLLNQLYDGFQSGTGKNVVGEVLDGLISYTASHFKYEEKIFDQIGYAETSAHKKEHDDLVKKVIEIQEKYKANTENVLTQEVMAFLRSWLTGHILGTDRKYVSSFKSHGVR